MDKNVEFRKLLESESIDEEDYQTLVTKHLEIIKPSRIVFERGRNVNANVI